MINESEVSQRVELFAGLQRACEEFPPLFDFLEKLAAIDGNNRNDLDTLIASFHAFLESIDLPSKSSPSKTNGNPLILITNLILALDDLNNGREPHLFKRQTKSPNRSMKTDWGLASDYLIAARRYLILKFKREGESSAENIAEKTLARKLQGLGTQLDAQGIDALCRYHNSDKARRNRRPDVRSREIKTDRELSIVLKQVATIMQERTA